MTNFLQLPASADLSSGATPVCHDAAEAERQAAQALPLVCGVALLKLRRLMRAEGHDVDVQRMCLDAGYAADQLAAAHTSSDAQLRATALALFEQYGRNRAARLH